MKVKYGALIVDGRGKLGGHVASKNKGGSYLRTKVTPGNPQSVDQQIVRNQFTASSQAWKGLTAAQRLAWNSAVSNFVGTDIFGDSKTLSGFQLFVKINNYIRFIGETPIAVPPLPASVPAFLTFSVAAGVGAGTIVCAFTGVIAATEKVILSATAPQSAGKSFVKSEYRKIAILTTADVTTDDWAAQYAAKFGAFPAEGTKIFFKMQQITIANGLPGAVISCSTIVVA